MKIKILILAGVLLGMSNVGHAQKFLEAPLPVQNAEIGVKVGLAYPLKKIDGMMRAMTFSPFGIEARYNFEQVPVDIGVLTDISFQAYSEINTGEFYGDGYSASSFDWFIGPVADYNFRQGRKVNPYAGLGVGLYSHNFTNHYPSDSFWTVAFRPRIGVELFYHLRLEAAFNLTPKGYGEFQFTIGAHLGGRPRKISSAE